ncbi:MAG: cyclodeaminase/cyclohydrolase family protein [Candidatus Omnitrophica bacterium]|nr:cyclodeaminase/cyclohydrolase family protein [Candidatus Omnitrophota bacterium]
MQEYSEGTVKDYLKELSEKKIVPGGGSAAALSAGLGAGLNLMVLNYSIKEGSSDLLPAKQKQQEMLDRISSFIDEDCKVFQSLMKALSEKRNAQKEYISAAAIPLEVCIESHESIGITDLLSRGSNKNLFTDVLCALHFLEAAFFSAKLNVEINLREIKDDPFVSETREKLAVMEEDVERKSAEIEARVREVLKQ